MASQQAQNGDVLNNTQLNKLGTRSRLLSPIYNSTVRNNISNSKPLIFHPCKASNCNKYGNTWGYFVSIYGALGDGTKARVLIRGIKPRFEVKYNPEFKISVEEFSSLLLRVVRELLPRSKCTAETIIAKAFDGYQETPDTFIRLSFTSLNDRQAAIKSIRDDLKYTITSEDSKGVYFRKACRDYSLSYASPCVLNDYDITVDSGDYVEIVVPVHGYNLAEDMYGDNLPTEARQAHTIVCCYDIEASSTTSNIPNPSLSSDQVVIISMTFSYEFSDSALLKVAICSRPTAPHPDYITIVVNDERALLEATTIIWSTMMPDFITTFNGGGFDWPFLVTKWRLYGMFGDVCKRLSIEPLWKSDDASLISMYFQKEKVKIEADRNMEAQQLQLPPWTSLDVMLVFCKLYPKDEKYSLNFFLAKHQMDLKEDMPIHILMKILTNGTPEEMREATNYCVVDSWRCHQLMRRRNVYADKRTVAHLSYTALYNSYYNADGMRVQSFVYQRGQNAGFLFSTAHPGLPRPTEKFGGAMVLDPIKGLAVSELTLDERIKHAYLHPDGRYRRYTVFDDILADERHIVNSHIHSQLISMMFDEFITQKISQHNKTFLAFVNVLIIAKIVTTQRVFSITGIIDDKPVFSVNINIIQQVIDDYLTKCSTAYTAMIAQLRENKYDTSVEIENIIKTYINSVIRTQHPITGLDIESLYPSCIQAFEISKDTLIRDRATAERYIAEGKQLHHVPISYSGRIIDAWFIRNNVGEDKVTAIYGSILRELFVKRKAMKRKLFAAKEKKEALEVSADSAEKQEEIAELALMIQDTNSRQLAFKLLMNTFYGVAGYHNCPFYSLEVAASVTWTGQWVLNVMKEIVAKEGCRTYYGDSVTSDTPIVVRDSISRVIDIKTIDTLSEIWTIYDTLDGNNKEQSKITNGLQIWSNGKWANIIRVIRHTVEKDIYRVNTHTGCIDVTADHSLLKPDLTETTPTSISIGDELLHSYPDTFCETDLRSAPIIEEILECSKCKIGKVESEYFYSKRSYKKSRNYRCSICKECLWIGQDKYHTGQAYVSESRYLYVGCPNEDEALVWGMFMGDGSCGCYNEHIKGRIKYSWVLNNVDLVYLDRMKRILEVVEPYYTWKILNTIRSSGVYKLVPSGRVKYIVTKYNKLFYDKERHKRVPVEILNARESVRRAFFNGFYLADGDKDVHKNVGCDFSSQNDIRFDQKGKIGSMGLYYLLKSFGRTVSINTYYPTGSKENVYRLTVSDKLRKSPLMVKKIFKLGCQRQQVYDIETDNGVFLGGVGALNVHNTDSVYISPAAIHYRDVDLAYYLGLTNKLKYWTSLIDKTFIEAGNLCDNINGVLRDRVGNNLIRIAYEEVLWPILFISKKKYCGFDHQGKVKFFVYDKKTGKKSPRSDFFQRGLESAKRTASPILKKIGEGTIMDILDPSNIDTPVEIVERKIKDVFTGSWDLSDFALSATYKPHKQNVFVHQFVNRLALTGNAPQPNERFTYIIVDRDRIVYDAHGSKIDIGKGGVAELMTVAREKGYRPNIQHYLDSQLRGQLVPLIGPWFKGESDEERDKNADKYIDICCKRYVDPSRAMTREYQNAYKLVMGTMIDCTSEVFPDAPGIAQYCIIDELNSSKPSRYQESLKKSERTVTAQRLYDANVALQSEVDTLTNDPAISPIISVDTVSTKEAQKETGFLSSTDSTDSRPSVTTLDKLEDILCVEYTPDTMKRKIIADAIKIVRNANDNIQSYAMLVVKETRKRFGTRKGNMILSSYTRKTYNSRTYRDNQCIHAIAQELKSITPLLGDIINLCVKRDKIYIDAIKIAREHVSNQSLTSDFGNTIRAMITEKLTDLDQTMASILRDTIYSIAANYRSIAETRAISTAISDLSSVSNGNIPASINTNDEIAYARSLLL